MKNSGKIITVCTVHINHTVSLWQCSTALQGGKIVLTVEDKKKILADHAIALWDTCRSCQREGSADASIKAIEPNDIPAFLKANPSIETIVCNGNVSYQTMKKTYPQIQCIKCPSTSAANARWSLDALVKEYGKWLKNE